MITVAILGGGFMGAAHAANYKALEGRVRVKTVASRQSERAAGYAGPYSVELEFSGEPWPPLDEVNEAMRQSYEHLRGLGLQ